MCPNNASLHINQKCSAENLHPSECRYRGVTYNKKSRKWQAVINTGGRVRAHIGEDFLRLLCSVRVYV